MVSFGLRPRITPLAFARSRPSPVRVLINSRSNSARPANTGHQAAMRCGGGALLGDRAQQVEEIAGRACQPVKPGDNKYIAFSSTPIRRANCLRSDRAPLIFSWKILVHLAAL